MWHSLTRLKWRLYLALALKFYAPTAHATARLAILGSMPQQQDLGVASQMVWVGVAIKTAEEGLLMPMYHLLGSTVGSVSETRNKVKISFAICLLVFGILCASAIMFCEQLVVLMGQQDDLISATVSYINVEMVGVVPASLTNLLRLVMVMRGCDVELYLSLAGQMVVSILLDFALASELALDLGVMGIAYSSAASSGTVFIVNVAIVWRELAFSPDNLKNEKLDLGWCSKWTKSGMFSAIESLVRNVVYLVAILRTVNLLEEQGNFWVCNTILWNWMLPPVLALAELLRKDVADETSEKMKHQDKMAGYLIVSAVVLLAWTISYPTWKWSVHAVLQYSRPQEVMDLVQVLAPFSVCLVPAFLVQSVFFAVGRADVVALTSIVGNCYLLTLYALMQHGLLAHTIQNLVWSLGSVFAVSLVINAAMYYFIVHRKSKLL
jgi:Na+-driven multidrug efflux pump